MKNSLHPYTHATTQSGFSLVECIISVGVLAVIAPISLATLSQAGIGSRYARAETRAPAIVETCLSEVRATQSGKGSLLSNIATGESFPSGGGVICLGFDSTGKMLGVISESTYSQGSHEQVEGKDVVYLAKISGDLVQDGEINMVDVKVSVETPASKPSEKRSHIDFLTRTP